MDLVLAEEEDKMRYGKMEYASWCLRGGEIVSKALVAWMLQDLCTVYMYRLDDRW